MNEQQVNFFKMKTCYILDTLEQHVDELEEHGLPKNEMDKINEFMGYLLKLNQQYVHYNNR